MKNRSLLVMAIAVLAICLSALWYLNRDVAVPQAAVPVLEPAKAAEKQAAPVAARTEVPEPKVETAPEKAAAPVAVMAPWERKIDDLLRSNIPETETAQILINMLPTLPPEGQSEAAQHISNLILDKDYNRVAPLIKNASLPEAVLDVFVSDLMNREDAVKLPVLLEIAKLPNHPHHEEAMSDLQIFLDGDFGTDWAKWDGAMKGYLKKQAEENAPDNAAPAGGVPKAQ